MARDEQTGMDLFLSEIGRYHLMTADEEIQLGHQVQAAIALEQLDRPLTREEQRQVKRGNRARRRFFEGNLRLVVYIAKRFARSTTSMTIEDLIQEGSLGLMRAIDKYEPERGYKFSTYAYWWIRQGITRAISYYDFAIRRPAGVLTIASKLPKVIHSESARLGRMPTTSELAVAMEVKEAELVTLLERSGPTLSLDGIPATVEDRTLVDLLADPNSLDVEALDNQLELDIRVPQLLELLQDVPEKERDCIERRYGLNGYTPHTFQEVANGLNVSRERARQLINRGLNQIRLRANNCNPIAIQESPQVTSRVSAAMCRRLKPLTAPVQQFA